MVATIIGAKLVGSHRGSRPVSVVPLMHRLAALSPLSILLLAAIGAKLEGPHGGPQVGKCRAEQCLRRND